MCVDIQWSQKPAGFHAAVNPGDTWIQEQCGHQTTHQVGCMLITSDNQKQKDFF